MSWLIDALRAHPELALFLTLAIGHGAGRLRIGSFQLGPVLGSLLAGVAVAQLGIPVPEALKSARRAHDRGDRGVVRRRARVRRARAPRR